MDRLAPAKIIASSRGIHQESWAFEHVERGLQVLDMAIAVQGCRC